MRNILSLILTIVFYFSHLSIHSQNLYFKHLGIKDGLSQVCIPSLYQDEYGAIWIGTSEGLNRYNGCSIQNLSNESNYKSLKGYIDKITGDSNGNIYILLGGNLININVNNKENICIKEKVQDMFSEKDTLWIVSDNSIFYYNNKKIQLFSKNISDKGRFNKVYVKGDNVYVTTRYALYQIKKKHPDEHNKILALNNSITNLYVDSSDCKWIGTWNGIFMVNTSGEKFHYSSNKNEGELTNNQVRSIIEDNYGYIWVGTFKGLDCFNKKENTWRHYSEYGDSPNTLTHSSILCLHKDSDGNILAGTYFGGVNMFNPDPHASFFYHAEPLRSDWLNFPVVGKISKYDNTLWICTEGGGLNLLNLKTGKFTHIVAQPNDISALQSNNLKSIYLDKEQNKVYIGTHLGGLFIYDIKSKTGKTLRHNKENKQSLPHNIVNAIYPYNEGLILHTQGGVVYMDKKTEIFSELQVKGDALNVLKKGNLYETMTLDSRGRIWLGHIKGGVTCVNLSNSHTEYYPLDSLKKNSVSCIYEDAKGEIYVCTLGAGLFHYVNHKNIFHSYNSDKKQIPNDFCYAACSAKNEHELYFIHGSGVSLFNTIDGKVIKSYRLFNQSYSSGSSIFRDNEGTIYIGGTNGLASIDETIFYDNNVKKSIEPDRLYIYNKEIVVGDSTGILKQALVNTSEIELKHNQNNITIEFTSFDYINNVHQPYEYQLSGFDKGWNLADGNRITYTNIPPGKYDLRVRYVKSQYDDKEHSVSNIRLIVTPPFYASVSAYIIYILVVITVIFVVVRFIIRQASLRTSLSFERKEKERIEAVNDMKIKFFTNISHEFRTPITLILGQIESLLNSENISITLQNKLQKIYRNAWNLRNLTTEVLDFQKQEEGFLRLRVEEHDIVGFVKKMLQSFNDFAKSKNLNIRFTSLNNNIPLWFDPLQMQKVISNLIINAIKYTSITDRSDIYVEIKKNISDVQIIVSDTGIGIAPNEINKIFTLFYQGENNKEAINGTGIGLSIVKNIVEMHHGKIDVQSEVNKGTTFTISIPLGNKHFSLDEIIDNGNNTVIIPESVDIQYIADEKGHLENDNEEPSYTSTTEKPVMIIVEDNEDLCSILKEVFQSVYTIHIFHNGAEALERVSEIHPDIIISDITIPGISGKELCYKVKNNVELSNISVILITGDMSMDNMLESFTLGADDYITKPFDIRVLQSRCRNILKNKKRIIAWCGNNTTLETSEDDAINESDRVFLKKCIDVIRENFENQDFDVNILANSMNMGRSTFYTKFKHVASIPPNEFIAKIKLEEAMAMLKENPELNISEISIRLGFSSPRYFSKMFKNFFGVTPQSVRK